MKIIAQKTLGAGLRLSVEFENDDIINRLDVKIQKAIALGVEKGGTLALDVWKKQAEHSLKSSLSYKLALDQGNEPRYKGNPFEYNITQGQRTRDGKRSVGIILEEGIEPFDMKEKILKGRQKVIVRFQYGSPQQSHSRKVSAEIEKVSQRYGKFKDQPLQHKHVEEMYGEEAANKINEQKTKNFSTITSAPLSGGLNTARPNLGGLVNNSHQPAYTREINYKWKTREFTGMRGDVTKSGKEIAVHTYSVFRTISKNSAADSWIHPGIRPKKILETTGHIATPQIKQTIETSIQNAIESD